MKLKWYIKERWNPQLGTYYVAEGQLTKEEAKAMVKNCIYGKNKMLAFNTESEYSKAVKELVK